MPPASAASRSRLVAIAPRLATSYGREVLHGFMLFARAQPSWKVLRVSEEDILGEQLFATHRIDGIVVHHPDEALTQRLASLGSPVVDVSSKNTTTPFPRVSIDDRAVGAMAANYFSSQGHVHFAFCGATSSHAAHDRCVGFQAALRRLGRDCASLFVEEMSWGGQLVPAHEAELIRWLKRLAKPLGLMVWHDRMGAIVAGLCASARLAVPEQIALVGVDNDETYLDLSPVPLSSVVPAAVRIGQEAGRILETLIAGGRSPRAPLLIPPVRLVARRSSERLVVDDPAVAKALTYLRANFHTPIEVDHLVKLAGVSRRELERRFRRAIGTTPHAEVMTLRIDHAKKLLLGTDAKLEDVAREVGFTDGRHLSIAFKARVGVAPRAFRVTNATGRYGR